MFAQVKVVPVLCSAVLALTLVVAPYKATFDNHFLQLHAQMAWGKDGGKGGGGSGGNKGNGEGNKGGNAGGNGGRGGGSGGGTNGDSGGNSGDKGSKNSAGNSGNVQGGVVSQSTPAESVAIDGATIEVRHRNGMSERIMDGRYVMKDAKGRTIINRTATAGDRSRLRLFDR